MFSSEQKTSSPIQSSVNKHHPAFYACHTDITPNPMLENIQYENAWLSESMESLYLQALMHVCVMYVYICI